jgi:L-asparaginase
MQAALIDAQSQGVAVLCAPRQGDGRIQPQAIDRLPLAEGLTPAKARVELMLRLMETPAR